MLDRENARMMEKHAIDHIIIRYRLGYEQGIREYVMQFYSPTSLVRARK